MAANSALKASVIWQVRDKAALSGCWCCGDLEPVEYRQFRINTVDGEVADCAEVFHLSFCPVCNPSGSCSCGQTVWHGGVEYEVELVPTTA